RTRLIGVRSAVKEAMVCCTPSSKTVKSALERSEMGVLVESLTPTSRVTCIGGGSGAGWGSTLGSGLGSGLGLGGGGVGRGLGKALATFLVGGKEGFCGGVTTVGGGGTCWTSTET